MASIPVLDLVILTCNRPLLLDQAVCTARISALLCKQATVNLIVSDNSTTCGTANLCRDLHPDIAYIKRSTSAHDHFDAVLSSSKADYLVMMHDDDRLMPDYLGRVAEELFANPSLTCVATNAIVIDESLKIARARFGAIGEDIIIKSPQELLSHYFGDEEQKIVPFPAYCYRLKSIKGLKFSSQSAGKYSDVLFLCSVAARGPIKWLNTSLYAYRYHCNNDSGRFDIRAMWSLRSILVDTYANGDAAASFLKSLNKQLSPIRLVLGMLKKHLGDPRAACKKIVQIITHDLWSGLCIA